MAFLDENYLLSSSTGRALFESVATLPIFDVHNHANVDEIAANANYADIWQVCAATDHYVWEMLRKRGVPEEYITGKNVSNEEKFLSLGKVFPQFVGNPVYEWIHLDLRRSLGMKDALLNGDSAAAIWAEANSILAREDKKPQALVTMQNIECMCSTDDPADLLTSHDVANASFGKQVIRPTWRPDKAVNIYAKSWKDYMETLGKRFGTSISSIDTLLDVLQASHEYFEQRGCVASDHGIEAPLSGEATKEEAAAAFNKAIAGKELTAAEIRDYMSYLTLKIAEMDARSNWVFQMHIGAVRDIRDFLFDTIGPDSGGDVSDHMIDIVKPLGKFLNKVDGKLKVVLYCLDPHHQSDLATVARAFGGTVRLGSAWWLNDTPIGMRRQLEYIGSVDMLWNFAGMVSDSRKILSYGSRFEMFRRVLSDVIGNFVIHGQMPENLARNLMKQICYDGPKEFYNL